jgi:hypothetical protein
MVSKLVHGYESRLEKLDMEYEDVLLRIQRLEKEMSDRNYTPALERNPEIGKGRGSFFLFYFVFTYFKDDMLRPRSNSMSQVQQSAASSSARAQLEGVDPLLPCLRPDDLKMLLTETVISSSLVATLNRFLVLLKWLPYSHRYDVLTRSVEILNRPKRTMRVGPAGKVKEELGFSSKVSFRDGSSPAIPLLISDVDSLDSALFQLAKYFNIINDAEEVMEENFAFKCARFFTAFMEQMRKKLLSPSYSQCTIFNSSSCAVALLTDSGLAESGAKIMRDTPVMATPLAATAASGKDRTDNAFVRTDGGASTLASAGVWEGSGEYDLDHTFLKSSPWHPYAPVPSVSSTQMMQQGFISQLPVDGLLNNERDFLHILGMVLLCVVFIGYCCYFRSGCVIVSCEVTDVQSSPADRNRAVLRCGRR